LIRKGEILGQGIIKPYLKVEGDKSKGIRTGGFGSTTN
jgi:dUTPase